MVEGLEAGKRVEFEGLGLSLIQETLMPAAVGYGRLYILSEGSGRYILGQRFGKVEAPCVFHVEPSLLFGFMPEEKVSLYEIALGKEGECGGEVIDLRPLEHGARHPLVMKRFSELKTDECFYIINDHDPLPLYFQMAMSFPKKVGWVYVEFRDNFWKIKIRRLS